MSLLPYRWTPLGADPVAVGDLSTHDLVAVDHQVWQVVSVSRRPADLAHQRPWIVVLQPPGTEIFTHRGERHLGYRETATVPVYRSGHYPSCSLCHEPSPCRDMMIEHTLDVERQISARFAEPGICPSCRTTITPRQATVTFETNLYVPLGPPVTFHTRTRCAQMMHSYDCRWIAQGHLSKLAAQQDTPPSLKADPP